MEPLKIYDYLTLARQRILECVRRLTAEQYGRMMPIGLGTLGRTGWGDPAGWLLTWLAASWSVASR
jgi:hypothetical protein